MMGINDFGSHVPYEVISDSKAINSLKSFRVYKLIRLIWLHIVTRLKYSNQHRLFPQRIELQQVYAEEKDAQTSEALLKFKKAIELNPTNDDAYLGLGKLYQDQSRFSEAEELYKKAIEPNPKDDRIYGALEVLFREMDNLRLAREYGKKAKELRSSYYYPITTDNYNKLKAVLDKRGITYVCVQYPMRNLEPLKKIFQGNAEGIIFVDNEQLFKDVLKKTSYREYFWDMFGGEFGHCTEKGNRLLAESIANTILKEVFNK
jgi:tetratricopeptide (TPR) repeat protein